MISQIKLYLVLKPRHCIPSIMSVKLSCQTCNKTYKTETRLNRRKAKCKERDKQFDNNEHNISSTTTDNDTTASRKIKYPRLQTSSTISSNTIDIICNKVILWRKSLLLLASGSFRKTYID